MKTKQVSEYVQFKHIEDEQRAEELHYLLFVVLMDMAAWCMERDIPFVITSGISTYEKDKALGRISDSHRTFRAVDVRSHVFTKQQRIEFMFQFNMKYFSIASISSSDNEPRMVVLHGDGANEHFHIALNAKFKLEENKR